VLRTPLNDLHRALGAKLVDYAGWEMPLLYTSIRQEHLRTRSGAGLFDVSHMGRVRFAGPDAARLLERLCTRRVRDMAAGQCRYTLLCNERGGVRDDALLYREDDDRFLLVVNAANRQKLLGHFADVAQAMGVGPCWEDATLQTCMVALQGPRARQLAAAAVPQALELKRYRFTTTTLAGTEAIVSRTGYTGEDGVEAIFPARGAEETLRALLDHVDLQAPGAPVTPVGLGARDTLRLEAGMPLYGHELGEDIPAFACGVDFAINLDKADDDDEPIAPVGFEALREQRERGAAQRIAGLRLEGGRTARQGMPVLRDGEPVGAVASACVAPTLGRPIATAFLDSALAQRLGERVEIDAGARRLAAEIVELPFYKAS